MAATDLPFVEPAPAFLARVRAMPPPVMLIDGFLPGDGAALLHGQPRSFKSWIMLETAIALTTGTPAFGICRIPTSIPVLYVTNEDSARRTGERLDTLLAGRGLTEEPEHLYLTIQQGVCLDDERWQRNIALAVQHYGCRVVMLDPLRSMTEAVDQGPHELQPFALWVRDLICATGVTVLLGHHDAKPPAGKPDQRQRPQRASGGGIFSIADAPIHCQRVAGRNAAHIIPNAWKFGETPAPMLVTLEVDDAAGTARLVGQVQPTDPDVTSGPDLATRITEYVKAHPDQSGNEVAKGVRAGKEKVQRALDDLRDAGILSSKPGPRGANLWGVAERPSGSD